MPLDVWEKETVLSEVGRNQSAKNLDEVNAARAMPWNALHVLGTLCSASYCKLQR